MIITLYIDDLPPMPRNRSHMLTTVKGRPMNIKTPLCREFEKDLTERLNRRYSDLMSEFKEAFDPDEEYIEMAYTIFTPKESLLTKDGRVSQKSTDLDAHKVMQDTIFRCIGLDDKLVRRVVYYSPVSNTGNWDYIVTLWTNPIRDLFRDGLDYELL